MQYIPNAPAKCAPIDIPEDDPVYSKVGARCMSVPRTDTNRDLNCSLELDQVEQVQFSKSNLYRLYLCAIIDDFCIRIENEEYIQKF